MNKTIDLRDVYKAFGSQVLLNNLTMTFHQNSSYAIQGVSGSGKSTLLALMAGFEEPTQGTILYNGTDRTQLKKEKNADLDTQIGFLFQQPRMIKELTVLENVLLPTHIRSLPPAESRPYALMLLEQVGLASKKDHFPATLSGGELQRAALARALMGKPSFLVADEPTSNLDTHASHAIVHLIRSLQETVGMGIIISTHDSTVAASLQEQYEISQYTLIKKA
jgi:ABC-type lipoprotein export system ATPase subunit